MRGKAFLAERWHSVIGITPAYAGKRQELLSCRMNRKDHPRVCGEKGSSTFWSRNHSGSPPRMRGKEGGDLFAAVVDGITPACAGKSCRLRQLHGAYRDHPRVCGEKKKLSPNFTVYEGSPPRVRGKETRLPPLRAPAGITPACAGKSCSSSVSSSQRMSWTIRSRI